MKKRFLCTALTLLLIFMSLPAFGADRAPSITSKAAIVVDFDTGYTIYEKNADAPRAPASMTKIMSLYSFFSHMKEHGLTLDSGVTISKAAASLSVKAGLSNVPLSEGEVLSVDTLVRAACVVSANAAVLALGELIAGSESAFVSLMNTDAAALGLTARFTDPAGINNTNSITPRSMAQLCRRIIKDYPEILDYTSLKTFTFKGKTYSSTNKLLDGLDGSYPGTDGMKTGYISAAGYCLTATAEREGRRIIAVTMGSSSLDARTTDGYALLSYGFKNLEETVEPIYMIGESPVSRLDDSTSVTLANVPQPFEGCAFWEKDGVVVLEYGYIWVDNGTAVSIDQSDPELELIISVGPYNVSVK